MVELAVENKVVQGRRMRVDTTVVETNIHYPTDSSLLGDGTRVLTRLMKRVTALAGAAGTKMRDRSRSVKLRVLDIARAARSKAPQSREKLERSYRKLLDSTSRVVGQAKRFSKEIADGVKRCSDFMKQTALEGLRKEIDIMLPRVKQVIRQTKARILGGDTHSEGKIFSIFEPSTENIRKGKAGKPNEFGKMVKVQEAENQIVTSFEVYDQRPSDSALLIPAIEVHEQRTGRTPDLASADAGFYLPALVIMRRQFGGRSQFVVEDRGCQSVAAPLLRLPPGGIRSRAPRFHCARAAGPAATDRCDSDKIRPAGVFRRAGGCSFSPATAGPHLWTPPASTSRTRRSRGPPNTTYPCRGWAIQSLPGRKFFSGVVHAIRLPKDMVFSTSDTKRIFGYALSPRRWLPAAPNFSLLPFSSAISNVLPSTPVRRHVRYHAPWSQPPLDRPDHFVVQLPHRLPSQPRSRLRYA